MRSRKVPVLRLGSRAPGVDARSLRLWTQASAIVGSRPQASDLRRTCRRDENCRETQNCRHFWTRLGSSRLKSINSTVTGIRGVVVAKRRTVVTFGLVLRLRVSKVSTVTGIGGFVFAKGRTVVTFGLAAGERKGERREEKREMRGENRGDRREKRRVDRRKERGERRQERGEKRGERREEMREERREEIGERREETEERGEKREEEKEEKGMTPDLRLLSGFACGVSLSLHVRVTCLHSGSWLLSNFL